MAGSHLWYARRIERVTRPNVSPRARWFLALLLLPAFMAGERAAAQEGPTLSVDPPAQTVGLEAEPFEVEILVDGVTAEEGLGGYTLALSYDPAVLHALTISDSGLLEGGENAFLCPATGIDNDTGQLAHLCMTLVIIPEPGLPVTGPKVLALVSFDPVGEGTTSLDLSQSGLMDPEGNDLAAATSNGEVTVQSGSSAPVIATPTDAEPAPADVESGGGGNAGLYFGLVAAGFALAIAAAVVLVRRRFRRSPDS